MYLEERVESLEQENQALRNRISALEKHQESVLQMETERYVTPKELAQIMQCTVQNVHRKIRNGSILATHRMGDARIPMSQFTPEKPAILRQKSAKPLTMQEQIFGKE